MEKSFSSKIGVLLAAAGSAVGLGSIWKFPYVVGENGGGAFIILYIACSLIFEGIERLSKILGLIPLPDYSTLGSAYHHRHRFPAIAQYYLIHTFSQIY